MTVGRTVLIVADAFDIHADVVESGLRNSGVDLLRVNLDPKSLRKTSLTLHGPSPQIKTPQGNTLLSEIGAVWVRRAFVESTLEERESETVSDRIWKNEWNRTLLGLYHHLGPNPWLSPLAAALRAENKYLQWSVAQAVGFRIPDTLTSNDKGTLMRFCRMHGGQVALKAMHQDIYRVDDKVVGLFTNLISEDDLQLFHETDENPITIQEYVPKAYEARYTVVGSDHFCCRIDSQAAESTKIDWRRYDIPKTPHYVVVPPYDIREKTAILMDKLGLGYGALDFIVTPDGEWVFLEVNPMGQWLWIEDLTGLPVSAAIGERLRILNQVAVEGTA